MRLDWKLAFNSFFVDTHKAGRVDTIINTPFNSFFVDTESLVK